MTLRALLQTLNDEDIVTVTDMSDECYAHKESLTDVRDSSTDLLESKVVSMEIDYIAKVHIVIE